METPEHHIHERLKNLEAICRANPQAPASNEVVLTFAFLLSKLAEVATNNALRLERVHHRTMRLTWVLAVLTAALLAFTVFLYKDTHALVQREQARQHHDAHHP